MSSGQKLVGLNERLIHPIIASENSHGLNPKSDPAWLDEGHPSNGRTSRSAAARSQDPTRIFS